jgi:hypothetical protein
MSALNKAWIFLKGRDQAKQNKFTHPFDEYGYPVYPREQDPETWKKYDERGRYLRQRAVADIPPEAFPVTTEEERRQRELGQQLDTLRRITGSPKPTPPPTRDGPAAGNA